MPLDLAAVTGLNALVLFGSHARGDWDELSDKDYCAMVSDMEFAKILDTREALASHLKVPLECVSIYTEASVNRMIARGSLFVEHLRREGIILYEKAGYASSALSAARPFDDFVRELQLYEELLDQVDESFHQTSELTFFDLHLLHGVIRDACILATYSLGHPAFGRMSAFNKACEFFPELPLSKNQFTLLSAAHIAYLRQGVASFPLPSPSEAAHLINRCREVVRFCERVIS